VIVLFAVAREWWVVVSKKTSLESVFVCRYVVIIKPLSELFGNVSGECFVRFVHGEDEVLSLQPGLVYSCCVADPQPEIFHQVINKPVVVSFVLEPLIKHPQLCSRHVFGES